METLYLLIPISVVLVFLIGIAFWWSLRNGQFDDLEGPAYRILMDDDRSPPTPPAGDVQPPGADPGGVSGAGKSDPSAANLDDS
ncbi:MAG: cbb3-type cytochrome oxidase assembly protein CcoS [Candidatus Accumulibacter sp. UW26]